MLQDKSQSLVYMLTTNLGPRSQSALNDAQSWGPGGEFCEKVMNKQCGFPRQN